MKSPQAAQILCERSHDLGLTGQTSHDASRGWACLLGGAELNHEVPCEAP